MKIIKVGAEVNYLGRNHIITDVTEQGVTIKRVEALPNEYSIYIRNGSERFFKIFQKEFNVEDIEVTDDGGTDVTLVKSNQQDEDDEEYEDEYLSLNDFIVNLTKAHTGYANKEGVLEFLESEIFDFDDPYNELKRFTVSCWLNRRLLVKFQTDKIQESLDKIQNRQEVYSNELRLFIESAVGDLTEPSAKELKSLAQLIPLEDEELIVNIIRGFDIPTLWLNQMEVKELLEEADSQFLNNSNKEKIMATIKGLSDNTVKEMLDLFSAEANARGLVGAEVEDTEEDEEEELDLEAMSIKELRAYCKEEGIDIKGLKTKDDILDAIYGEDEEEADDEEEEADEDEIDEEEAEDIADEEAEDEEYTEEELEEYSLKDLREIADEDFGIEGVKKMKKPALIEAILEAQAEDEDNDMPDFESMTLKELRDFAKDEGIDTKGLKKQELIDELEALYE